MSVGASSINRVSKQNVGITEEKIPATKTKKKSSTAITKSKEKTQPAQKIEHGLENKIYCLTDELPYYLL